MSFEYLINRWLWKPIRDCPGRFILKHESNLSLEDLVGTNSQAREFCVMTAKDLVVVIRFEDGGLISYKRADGSYLHTLNTIDGFTRKLAQLGIDYLEVKLIKK